MSTVTKVVVSRGPAGPAGAAGAAGATGPQGPAGLVWAVHGSPVSPELIGVTGVTFNGQNAELHLIQGNGGPVVVTSAFDTTGAVAGMVRRLVCLDPINTVTMADGSGLDLTSDTVEIGAPGSRTLDLQFNGVNFMEIGRS